ncbi:zinc ribbon domain-containing protein [Streptomyces glomeratus]|uniref:Cas12f1-like TNB domain-containing protein n=1 Tax=Streptomyces glomeratus TaxID=284452 RepID=A0ABP6LRU3_9ACTN|nr:zinc ribbon domain-containing protein [Streptomyces glomeratus]MCF1510800.1 zinc ribbon domain-containing protein [Streptomyces glomeratus]
MSRKLPLADGERARTACARALIRAGVDEKSGEVLTPAGLVERVGWCVDLVAGMTSALLAGHWNTADVNALASGQDAAGRRLPSNAWMALRRLGWTVAPDGVKVNDRIVRMAQEMAGRALRSVKWRADLAAGVLAAWPADPAKRTAKEWDQVRGVIPGGQYLPSSVIRSRTRQAVSFQRKHGRLPADVFELEGAPRVARMLLLAACDAQQATIQRCDDGQRALLRLKLPTRPDPHTYADWTWVACPIALPPTVPANAVIHLPTVYITGGKVRADLAYTHCVPKTRRAGHTVALGVDWGLGTLLSAGAARLHDDGRISTLAHGAQFRAAGVQAKQYRLRRVSERLHAKTDHYVRLADPALQGKAAVLAQEIRRVSERRSNLNDALAWSAARWAVDQAIAAGATVIYLEDLRSMEAGGMGRTHNIRLSQTVRGQITDRMRHLTAEVGIAVVTVPARNTSKHCPHCLTPLRHRKAPDRPAVSGWKWAICPNPECGWQGDRDQGAWQRIAARGLAHQTKTIVDHLTGQMVIRAVVDTMEAKAVLTTVPKTSRTDRSKTGPTRPRTNRLTPRRREVPSPAKPTRPAGQRPEGHAPPGRTQLPRAADRHQGVTTISTPTTRRHRPRGATLGAGFHLHAHASPPRWAEPVPDHTVHMGPHS